MLGKGHHRFRLVSGIFVCLLCGFYIQYIYTTHRIGSRDDVFLNVDAPVAKVSFKTCNDLVKHSTKLPLYQKLSFEETIKDVELSGWEEAWISEGLYDEPLHGPLGVTKIDAVYTWVNGTEPQFQHMKQKYENSSSLNIGTWFKVTTNRYRDWDELRYSIRSLCKHRKAAWLGNVHVLVTETAAFEHPKSARHMQVPGWLKTGQKFSDFNLVTHRDVFTYQSCLPTFNSFAIESQMPNLKNTTTEHVISMNDDMLLGELSSSDIYNALFGSAFSFHDDKWTQLTRPVGNDLKLAGETSPALYSSWLLNQRFGQKSWYRPAHSPRSVNLNIMREAYASFPQDAITTAVYRFRHEGGQVNNWFLVYHYTIERHREALLWSYIMMKMDANQDGYLNLRKRHAIKDEYLLALRSVKKRAGAAMLPQVNEQLKNAGLEAHSAYTPKWTSIDGPMHLLELNAKTCTAEFTFDFCFGGDFLKQEAGRDPEFYSSAVYDRITRQFPACGDCLIHTLLSTTPIGLSPLLPETGAARLKAIKAIHKYRYVVGDIEGIFSFITEPSSISELEETLENIYKPDSDVTAPGYLCMNDDMLDDNSTNIQQIQDKVLSFLGKRYPNKSKWER